jgi:predicted RNase H-like nuclease
MTQPETNTGLRLEFDSVRMRSNLVLIAIYKKGQNFKIFKNCKKIQKFHKISKFSKNFKISKFQYLINDIEK